MARARHRPWRGVRLRLDAVARPACRRCRAAGRPWRARLAPLRLARRWRRLWHRPCLASRLACRRLAAVSARWPWPAAAKRCQRIGVGRVGVSRRGRQAVPSQGARLAASATGTAVTTGAASAAVGSASGFDLSASGAEVLGERQLGGAAGVLPSLAPLVFFGSVASVALASLAFGSAAGSGRVRSRCPRYPGRVWRCRDGRRLSEDRRGRRGGCWGVAGRRLGRGGRGVEQIGERGGGLVTVGIRGVAEAGQGRAGRRDGGGIGCDARHRQTSWDQETMPFQGAIDGPCGCKNLQCNFNGLLASAGHPPRPARQKLPGAAAAASHCAATVASYSKSAHAQQPRPRSTAAGHPRRRRHVRRRRFVGDGGAVEGRGL